MGQQLERRCEFASALKYYYTGKAYYSKLDKFGSLPCSPDSKLVITAFQTNPNGLYQTMFEALQEVAISGKHNDWAKKHWASWADDQQKLSHLKACLNSCVSDAPPCLQTVRCADRVFASQFKADSTLMLHFRSLKTPPSISVLFFTSVFCLARLAQAILMFY
jgi:hypothetical protein